MCVHRYLRTYLRTYLRNLSPHLSPQPISAPISAGAPQVRVYKEVWTRALGDSQQTPAREGAPQRTRELKGDLVPGVSNLVEFYPIQGGNRA